jgi:hypothetical protein
MKKITRYFKIGYLSLIVLMLTAWLVRYSMLGGSGISPKIENAINAFADFPAKVFHFFKQDALKDERYIDDAQSKSGFIYYADTSKISPGFLLISTFSNDKNLEIALMDIKKNKLVRRWTMSADTILHCTNSAEVERNNIRLMHPLLLKDSSLIFSTELSLIKINKGSKIVWVNKKIFHHSIEYAGDTAIWVCATIVGNKPVFRFTNKDTLVNEGIALVNSTTGKISFQKSIYDILNENGYKYLMAIGNFENDAFHLNEVNPATKDSKYWKKGDLLISIRDRNTVFLYRPSTNKILWLKTGPWANQHDCSFLGDSGIMVLGNDVIRSGVFVKLLQNHNNIYTYSFKSDKIDTPYIKILDQLKLKTYTEGRCNILPNGDVFFDDTNNGKVYIFDKNRLKLTYCERIDGKHIKMMNLVRYIPQ